MKRVLIVILLLAAFAAGIVHLFQLRFEGGDIYPAYSSLRADPLGSKALYESLGRVMPVHRHYRPLDRLGSGTNTAVLMLGATPDDLERHLAEVRGLERALNEGAQLIVTFLPRGDRRLRGRARPAMPGAPPPAIELLERWGTDWDTTALEDEIVPCMLAVERTDLPLQLDCRTALHFDDLSEDWRVIYEREPGLAVLVERPFGEGRIVACADAFWLSNEGLLREGRTELLVWLLGGAEAAVFDEGHLGVMEQPGVAALMRRYRLHALVGCVLLLAVLFAWKNAATFLPPPEESPEASIRGRETTAGVINLLRRSIPPAELLGVCLDEWNKTCRAQVPAGRLRRLQALVEEFNQTPPRQRDPVAAYARISRILRNK